MRKSLIWCLVMVLACSIVQGVNAREGRVKWWKNPKIAEELDLTSTQVDSIESIFSSYKEKIISLKSVLNEKEKELRSVIKDPNSTKDEVLKRSEEVGRTKGDLRRLELSMFLEIREVLTPEQREKLQNIKARYR